MQFNFIVHNSMITNKFYHYRCNDTPFFNYSETVIKIINNSRYRLYKGWIWI